MKDTLKAFDDLEAAIERCYVKKLFLEILQNSQENNRAGVSFLIKLQAWGLKYEVMFFDT